jgi:hypothetical protein
VTGACKRVLIFFKDVEVGMLNCNVKWKISEKVKLFDVKYITCIFWHEQKLDHGRRDIKR